MRDRPTASELLITIADTLDADVVPAAAGPAAHQARVAANLCRIIERELRLGPAADEAARTDLVELLGSPGGADLTELTTELDGRLAAGDPDLERRAWPVLVSIVRNKLAIDKPGYADGGEQHVSGDSR